MKIMQCPYCHNRFPSTSYLMYKHVKNVKKKKNNIIVL